MALVTARLLGEPSRVLGGGHELRYGRRGSLSVGLEAGIWFDHERHECGGVLDLVRRQLGCDPAAAYDGLRCETGLGPALGPGPSRRPGTRVVARHVHTDAEGRPLFRVVRREPRRSGQERFAGGRWVAGRGVMGDVCRVLYRGVDRDFREQVRRVHRLGPRAVGERLAEVLEACPQASAPTLERLDRHEALDREAVARLGGADRVGPAAVTRLVAAGRA